MIATLESTPAPAWLYIACWCFCIVVSAAIGTVGGIVVFSDARDESGGPLADFGWLVAFCLGTAFAIVLSGCMVIDLWPR